MGALQAKASGTSTTTTTATTSDLCQHVASLCPASAAQTEELLGCSSPAQLRSVATALTSPDTFAAHHRRHALAAALEARADALQERFAAVEQQRLLLASRCDQVRERWTDSR